MVTARIFGRVVLAALIMVPTLAQGASLEEIQAACKQKKPGACNLLGKVLVMLKDHKGAEAAFKIGCDAGDGTACFGLGEQLDNRDKTTEAQVVFKKACTLGNHDGCGKVGRALLDAKKPDALDWLRKGCTGPDDLPLNCVVLGRKLWNKGEKDKAREVLRFACASDREHRAFGCGELGWVLMNGSDGFAATELALLACLGGDHNGCHNRGVIHLGKNEFHDAIPYLRKACDGKLAEGCSNLGVALARTGDKAGAEVAIRKACDAGSVTGCANLAAIMRGKGNLAEARRLWEKACKEGDSESCRQLKDNMAP